MHLRLATYNIHAGIGTDGRFDPGRIVGVLQELEADVLALQEVENHRIDNLELLQLLGSKSGLQAIAGPTLQRETRHYGNALLTRLPVRQVRRVNLSLPQREPRGAIDAVLAWGELELRVIATHLGLRPGERRAQIRHLLALLEVPHDGPVALLGDLNEWFLWGRPLRWLHRHFSSTPHLPTWPSRFPLFALDRIWVRPRSALITLTTHDSPLARRASDHLPIRAWMEHSACR
jgi:endonuclease/exonuclease/phosphatase family metal-dependent hydrolase